MKKRFSILLSAIMLMSIATGCSDSGEETTTDSQTTVEQGATDSKFDISTEITIISREDGSGTRGAFTELFDIIEKTEDGKKIDMTTDYADITQSTGVMLTSVSSNEHAIGYVSLGSLSNEVKALSIDGVSATKENIKNEGNYSVDPSKTKINVEKTCSI